MIIESHQHFWWVRKLAAEYHQQLEIIESYISTFSIEDKKKIMVKIPFVFTI